MMRNRNNIKLLAALHPNAPDHLVEGHINNPDTDEGDRVELGLKKNLGSGSIHALINHGIFFNLHTQSNLNDEHLERIFTENGPKMSLHPKTGEKVLTSTKQVEPKLNDDGIVSGFKWASTKESALRNLRAKILTDTKPPHHIITAAIENGDHKIAGHALFNHPHPDHFETAFNHPDPKIRVAALDTYVPDYDHVGMSERGAHNLYMRALDDPHPLVRMTGVKYIAGMHSSHNVGDTLKEPPLQHGFTEKDRSDAVNKAHRVGIETIGQIRHDDHDDNSETTEKLRKKNLWYIHDLTKSKHLEPETIDHAIEAKIHRHFNDNFATWHYMGALHSNPNTTDAHKARMREIHQEVNLSDK